MSRKATIVLLMILLLIITLTACNAGSTQGKNLQAGENELVGDFPRDEPDDGELNDGDLNDDKPNETERTTPDFEYSMICESLTSEGTLGEERIVDGVKLITSTPYGFDNANEFLLYLPGKKADELPEAYISWSQGMASSGVLTCYGLYNVRGEQGFIQ